MSALLHSWTVMCNPACWRSRQIGTNLDRGGQANIIYLDRFKSFDKVNHAKLLRKLHEYFFFFFLGGGTYEHGKNRTCTIDPSEWLHWVQHQAPYLWLQGSHTDRSWAPCCSVCIWTLCQMWLDQVRLPLSPMTQRFSKKLQQRAIQKNFKRTCWPGQVVRFC